MVLRSAVGAWFTAPATAVAVPLSYMQATPAALGIGSEMSPQRHWWRQIGTVPPYSRVSCVAVASGLSPRLACALGSTCRILIPQLAPGWALATLPSGQLSFLKNDVFVYMGAVAGDALRRFAIPNAGYGRRLGYHPTVRGTARNPNDHPHGGRTRAIRYPRTP